MSDPQAIEVFPVHAPPNMGKHKDIIEAVYVKGNMGGLVIIKLQAGELPVHSHEQEHVGVVLEGSFEFFSDDGVVTLHAGDVYRIRPNVPHGIRCSGSALIIQARAT